MIISTYFHACKNSALTFHIKKRHVNKQIAKAVIDDDEKIDAINQEIDATSTTIGQFQTNLPTAEEEE